MWINELHEESHGIPDLVAHFFRRAFNLIAIATTVLWSHRHKNDPQGDTRAHGLRWICTKGGGIIYAGRRRYKWPGTPLSLSASFGGRKVTRKALSPRRSRCGQIQNHLTAFLFHAEAIEDPAFLRRCGKASVSIILAWDSL